jgi:uncharacterized membrane protein YGL010W
MSTRSASLSSSRPGHRAARHGQRIEGLTRCSHATGSWGFLPTPRLPRTRLTRLYVLQVNVAIHIICVPAIFTTALILSHAFGSPSFLAVSPPAFLVPLIGSHLIQFTPTFLVALSYAAYFIALDPVAGGIYAPLLAGMGHFSNVFVETNGEAMKIAGAVSLILLSWTRTAMGSGVVRELMED